MANSGLESHLPKPRAPLRKALAIRGGALGDFILTLPSLRALREAGYEVELLTRPAYGRLAVEAGLVSGWCPLDSPGAALLTVPGAWIDPDWHQWLSGFEQVISWVPDGDGAFQEQVLRHGAGAFHQGDARCIGTDPAAVQLAGAVAFTGSSFRPITDLFAVPQMSGTASLRQIAFHPGSGSARKNWPLECWLEVMKRLSRNDSGLSWLVITGEVEEPRLTEIFSLMNRAGLRWESAHAMDLTDLCSQLRKCGAFLGHDSGISHLAAACGVPCRLLFGPTDPAVWAPLGDHVKVMMAPGRELHGLAPDAVIDWLQSLPI